MILLWFLCSVLLAGLIARYNESNKLFWILFTSFVVGIAGGHMYSKYNSNTSHGKEYYVGNPTQGVPVSVMGNVTTETGLHSEHMMPNPVSKDSVNEYMPINTPTVSKCCAETHTPPPRTKTTIVCMDSLTHPEKGYK